MTKPTDISIRFSHVTKHVVMRIHSETIWDEFVILTEDEAKMLIVRLQTALDDIKGLGCGHD